MKGLPAYQCPGCPGFEKKAPLESGNLINMRNIFIFLLLIITVQCIAQQTLENTRFAVAILKNGNLRWTDKTENAIQEVTPRFSLFFRPDDPDMRERQVLHLAYRIPMWKRMDGKGYSWDVFKAAEQVAFKIQKTTVSGGKISWAFAPTAYGRLEAILQLTSSAPEVQFTFTPSREGYFSVAFSAFEEVPPAALESLWQPLIWQEKRFPDSCYVSAEFMCSVPAVFMQSGGRTLGLSAASASIPFRMPTLKNSRCGLLLRNEKGRAEPRALAPLFGGSGSHRKAGEAISFTVSLLNVKGDCQQAYRYAAHALFGFRDYRQNATCSLNEALQNMITYAMDDHYAHWVADLKGSDYVTDVKGTVKNVSSLHPLSVAIVTDNKEVFTRRALPMVEYMMSREKYLFSLVTDEKRQSPSHFLRGPAAEVSELAALYNYSNGNSGVFRQYAINLAGKPRQLNLDLVSEGGSWQNALALYRMTNDKQYLEKAVTGAAAYVSDRITKLQTDFSDAHINGNIGGQFWTDFAPKWIDLVELYEETKDERFLKAAQRGAGYYTMFAWMQPAVPDGNIVIHKGDSIHRYYINKELSPKPESFPVQEQLVPAWRVSNVGLTPEASNTYSQNQGVLLTHYAAYMMRLSGYTGDSFLKEVSRAAIVGRYCNYPGYDINHEYTTLNQRADYPYHDVNQYTYNQMYYNHIWPQIALTLDYLVTDVEVKSAGKIRFPSQYAQGYAYLQSKVYGGAPGEFFGDRDVNLWMPANLLALSNVQVNHLSGYGNGKFYLALSSQSRSPEQVTVQLNPDVLHYNQDTAYEVLLFQHGKPAQTLTMQNGRLQVELPAHGLIGIVVNNMPVKTHFQHRLKPMPSSSTGYFREAETAHGKVTGMIFNWGRGLRSAYVWLSATEKDLRTARLHYQVKNTWKVMEDNTYPFEFSVPLDDGDAMGYKIEFVNIDNVKDETETWTLD
jgi:hypothetical protein